MSEDLENVISDSLTDAMDPEPAEATAEVDTSSESLGETPADTAPEADASSDVASGDEAQQASPVADEWAKKHGVAPQQPGQRENRLPYSRVKKIVENAEKRAVEPLQAKVVEFEAKVKDYEERLTRVGEFERVMVQEPVQFLEMLNQIPAYAQIFSQLQRKDEAAAGAATPAVDPYEGMPQPDETLPDGSKVYSLKGLAARDEWNRQQAKKEILAEVQQQFGPILDERQARQRYEAMIPQVQKQIEEARTWPQFKENEDAIVAALAANDKLSLEGAYRQVVLPRFQTDEKKLRDEIRKQVLADLKKAPATSAPVGGTRPRPVSQSSGPRNLEDVIKESMGELQR